MLEKQFRNIKREKSRKNPEVLELEVVLVINCSMTNLPEIRLHQTITFSVCKAYGSGTQASTRGHRVILLHDV